MKEGQFRCCVVFRNTKLNNTYGKEKMFDSKEHERNYILNVLKSTKHVEYVCCYPRKPASKKYYIVNLNNEER